MMLYQEYEVLKAKCMESCKMWEEVMEQKEELFAMTLPSAVRTDKEKISGGMRQSTFDVYLIKKEQLHIEEKIMEIESIIECRKKMLKQKEGELRVSRNLHDRIYTMRYIDHSRVKFIAKKIGYSESQIYRILEIIEEKTKLARKCETECGIKVE